MKQTQDSGEGEAGTWVFTGVNKKTMTLPAVGLLYYEHNMSAGVR